MKKKLKISTEPTSHKPNPNQLLIIRIIVILMLIKGMPEKDLMDSLED